MEDDLGGGDLRCGDLRCGDLLDGDLRCGDLETLRSTPGGLDDLRLLSQTGDLDLSLGSDLMGDLTLK